MLCIVSNNLFTYNKNFISSFIIKGTKELE